MPDLPQGRTLDDDEYTARIQGRVGVGALGPTPPLPSWFQRMLFAFILVIERKDLKTTNKV